MAAFFVSSLRMHAQAYLRSAAAIVEEYKGDLPLSVWLKNHFRQHKKFGSRDRKAITDLCYCFYRLGGSLRHLPINDQLLWAQFLCHTNSAFINECWPHREADAALPLLQKLALAGVPEPLPLFPFVAELSPSVTATAFALSHLVQPDLFLRIRPHRQQAVIEKLKGSGVPFEHNGTCLRLPNNSRIDALLAIDKEIVVQDKNSQEVFASLLLHLQPKRLTVWDCCAASGGKSILLHDLFPEALLTVSDIRQSILHNLRGRFARAGISRYNAFVADVSADSFRVTKQYDVVICDAPCSGSGTWARTPEQVEFFAPEKIDYYAGLQRRIAGNAARAVKKGGYFLYITCSVFAKENEAVVDYLQKHAALSLLEQRYLKGYEEKADTLFTALFRL